MTDHKEAWSISPRPKGVIARLSEVIANSDLVWFFFHQSTTRFYARTVMGRFWLVIRPVMQVAVHILFFDQIIQMQDGGQLPFAMFYLAAMISWHMFDSSLMWCTRSLELNRKLLTKIYFPRMILPFAYVGPAMYDTAILSALFVALGVYYYLAQGVVVVSFTVNLLMVVPLLLLSSMFGVAIACFTSVWGVAGRDVRFGLRYIVHFWFFLTPVVYAGSRLHGKLDFLLTLNPMAPLVTGMRVAVFDYGNFEWYRLGASAALTLVIFFFGARYFVAQENKWIDQV